MVECVYSKERCRIRFNPTDEWNPYPIIYRYDNSYGHKDNADFNAAKNIRNRVLVTVLRESLLKQLDNGAFEPKKLKRDKVKEVLLSFRRNLQKNARSECTEISMTTFDYI